ncbi:nardilysin isoform X2 [Falco naumanni]|uniref:nardilysin isoform X2 n=1 Tax=Falco naumanni TaxID=148594 RepID=UPI001ADEAD8F|nr:nardilysin isoform X2 [Falco naumanni]
MRRLVAAFVWRGRAVRAGARGLAGRGRPVRAVAQPLWCRATAAMPGRNKATSSYSCPELAVGQQAGEGGRDARGRSPHGEEEDRADFGPGPNLGDPAIVKSPSDPKQYRYIKLQNGLCALLISDLNYLDGAPAALSSEEEEEDDDGESEEESDEDDDSGAEIEDGREGFDDEDCDEGDEGEDNDGGNEDFNDPDDSELEELADKEETRKRGCTEKQSAAALCVAAGSFSDPEDLPGLAHFLEHMVFMGSLKYPDENGFDAFLKKHGGSDNASTDCERTVFQFDVQRKYFKEALDRKKFWALALYGGNGETGFEQNSTYSIFSISVTLTDEGYKHFYEVAHIVFQYVKMLQKRGPDKRIWEEIQKIEANEFHYQEQTDPVDYVESLCENMQLFQKEDFLTGDQLLFEYKPEIIADALNQLSPQRANLVLLSAANEGQCHLKEKWFGTQYSVEDIDKYWSDLWASDFELNQDLHLPEENKYIATDFALKVADCPETEYPVKTLSTQQGCLWYRKDDKFKIPKGYVRFHLISPLIQQSAENIVLFDTFVSILSHNLGEPAYEADVAQLEYKLVAGEHGLVIRVKGFNHKLPLLFQLIIDYLSDFSFTPAVFEMITEQLKKTYFNILIKPETLAKDVRLLILEHGRWSMIDKYQTLMNGLSIESLSSFVKAFKSQLFVEGLVQGNFTSREAKDFLNYVVQKLQFAPLAHPCPVQFRVVDLPNSHLLCKVKTLNKGDANSEVTVYYQSGARNLREYTLMELLVMHMEEPCFDFLRTKQTLGYHVYPTCRNTSGILGFSVTVATQATKYNSELVDKKIEEFLSCFEEKIKHLTEDAFSTQVTALIKLKECEDSHLGEEVDRNWNEVVTQQYLFDRLAREIEALKSVSKSDLVTWFQAHRSNKKKVLSVHVVGYGKHEGDSEVTAAVAEVQNSSSGEIPHLIFLPPSSLMTNVTSIKDIKAYTSTLNVLPYHKILK